MSEGFFLNDDLYTGKGGASSSSSSESNNPQRFNNQFELFRSTEWRPLIMTNVIENWNMCLSHPFVRGPLEVLDGRMFCRPTEIDEIDDLIEAMAFEGVPPEMVQSSFERFLELEWKPFIRKALLWSRSAGFIPVVLRPHKTFKFVPDCPHPALGIYEGRHNSTGTLDVRVKATASSQQADQEREADVFQTNARFISREKAMRMVDAFMKKNKLAYKVRAAAVAAHEGYEMYEEQQLSDDDDMKDADEEIVVEGASSTKKKTKKTKGKERKAKRQKVEKLPKPVEKHPEDEKMISLEQREMVEDRWWEGVRTYQTHEPMFQADNGQLVTLASVRSSLDHILLVPTTVIQSVRMEIKRLDEFRVLKLDMVKRSLQDRIVVESTADKEAKAMMNESGAALAHLHNETVKDAAVSELAGAATPAGGGDDDGPRLSKHQTRQNLHASFIANQRDHFETQAAATGDLANFIQQKREQVLSRSDDTARIIKRLGTNEKPTFAQFKDGLPDYMEIEQDVERKVCKMLGVPDQLTSHAEVNRNTKTRSAGPDDSTERVFFDTVFKAIDEIKWIMEDLLSLIYRDEMGVKMALNAPDGADMSRIAEFTGMITVVFTSLWEPAFLQHMLDIGMLDEQQYVRYISAPFVTPKQLFRQYPQIPLFTSQGFQTGQLEMDQQAEMEKFQAALAPKPAAGGASKGKTGGSGKAKPAAQKMQQGRAPATGMFGSRLLSHRLGPAMKPPMNQSAMKKRKRDLSSAPSAK